MHPRTFSEPSIDATAAIDGMNPAELASAHIGGTNTDTHHTYIYD